MIIFFFIPPKQFLLYNILNIMGTPYLNKINRYWYKTILYINIQRWKHEHRYWYSSNSMAIIYPIDRRGSTFWGARDNNQVVIKTFLLMSYKKSQKYKHILFNLCLGIIDRFKDIWTTVFKGSTLKLLTGPPITKF